jgi:hypothetical protein
LFAEPDTDLARSSLARLFIEAGPFDLLLVVFKD